MREIHIPWVKPIPSKKALIAFVMILLGFFLIASRFFSDVDRGNTKSVQIGNDVYVLEIADTDALRKKGLGGRDSLCETCGMLFVFEQPDRYAFWMKDMRFPLTLIWLAGDRVVFVARDISPDFSSVIDPPASADRVIEINADRAVDLNPGDQVRFFP